MSARKDGMSFLVKVGKNLY